jgi:hypothetical protein
MKSNAEKMLEPPYNVNPVTRLWQNFDAMASYSLS